MKFSTPTYRKNLQFLYERSPRLPKPNYEELEEADLVYLYDDELTEDDIDLLYDEELYDE